MPEPTVTIDFEAEDQLGVIVRKITVESLVKGDLRRQAHAVVEKITYLGGELRVLEVDGVAGAVQIRTRKPQDGRYVEVVLRQGNSVSFEPRPEPLNLSRADVDRLVADLKAIIKY